MLKKFLEQAVLKRLKMAVTNKLEDTGTENADFVVHKEETGMQATMLSG